MHRYTGLIMLLGATALAAAYSLYATSIDRGSPVNEAKVVAAAAPQPAPATVPMGHGFDFYVLSLSWSPSYCLSDQGAGNRQQCGGDADYGLVVHGLWPQFERGYPADCQSSEPARVPERLGRTLLDIMPGMGLIGHQWRKHGTCSGLSQADYFRVTRAALDQIAVPDAFRAAAPPSDMVVSDVERLFIAANDGMKADGIAVTCDDGRLQEVRICLAKDLTFRACPEVDRRSCNISTVSVPAIR